MAALRLHALIGTMLIAAAGCAGQPRHAGAGVLTAAATGAPNPSGQIDARSRMSWG